MKKIFQGRVGIFAVLSVCEWFERWIFCFRVPHREIIWMSRFRLGCCSFLFCLQVKGPRASNEDFLGSSGNDRCGCLLGLYEGGSHGVSNELIRRYLQPREKSR